MTRKVRLGVLVPSSNTAVEPLTQAIISSIRIPDTLITVHFSRFAVTEISQSSAALSQFNLTPILAATELLAHAKVDVIGWSGTSAGWLGFDKDEEMCRAIQEATGIPATTSTLALNKLLRWFGNEDVGLVTPYLSAMNQAIIRNYAGIGVKITHELHLDITDNVTIGEIDDQQLTQMVESIAADGILIITTFCTNFRAASLVAGWEAKHDGIRVFDTVATVIWDMLYMVSVETNNVTGWGSMFEIQHHPSMMR